MAYQSLYRRYRPQTFGAIKGQDHVVAALQGAVRDGKVGHAYLLHGPRGTGKTTAARVLAKALNCLDLGADGEPCTVCESCVAIEQGRSFDLHELDAASNNKVDDMRDLLSKVNLGTPGRAKVYLLDEAHMLTAGAENALLKTLEEPPEHVTWVLATTEPHKVVDTIRSRCQVFELGLLGADLMEEHVRWVVADAGLDVDDAAIDHVIAVGRGSVRDTLSALDRVVAAGGITEADTVTDTLLTAVAERDVGAALVAVEDAIGRGRDPRTIGEAVLAGLRDAFLAAMGSPSPRLAEPDRVRAERIGTQMPAAAITRALDGLGTALVDMRQAPDPRVDLEVALVRLCRPETDQSLDALLERIERLERHEPAAPTGSGAPGPPPAQADAPPVPLVPPVPAPAPPPSAPEPANDSETGAGPTAAARRALAASRRPDSGVAKPAAAEPARPPQAAPPIDPASLRPTSPTEVVELAATHLGLDRDVVIARARELLPPTSGPRDPEELAPLWQALVRERADDSADTPSTPPSPDSATDASAAVPDTGGANDASAPAPEVTADDESDPGDVPPYDESDAPVDDHEIDVTELVDAPSHTETMVERLAEVFPGAELLTTDENGAQQ